MATIERQESVIQTVQISVVPVDGADLKAAPPLDVPPKLDIEHAVVQDDPREWSKARKAGFQILCAHIVLIPTNW